MFVVVVVVVVVYSYFVIHLTLRYYIMAGTPEKMLEHLVETRIDKASKEDGGLTK